MLYDHYQSIGVMIFALLFASLGLAQSPPSDYPRFEVVDLGTFGGPNGWTSGSAIIINPAGTITSTADTSRKVSSCKRHPLNQIDCYVQHAFSWSGGELSDLGTLGGDDSFGFWINADGDIVGQAEDGTFDSKGGFYNQRAALWHDGAITDLGSLGGPQAFAFSINNRGQIAGGANTSTLDNFSLNELLGLAFFPTNRETHAVLWHDGILTELGTLGGPDAIGTLINERGEVAGLSFTDYTVRKNLGTPPIHGFVWSRGQMFDIGTFGGDYSAVSFFNNRGQASGFANLSGNKASHAFFWEAGNIQDLGTLGGNFSSAYWVSDAGQVVGQANLKGDEQVHAFSWLNGKMSDLGTLAGDSCSSAFTVNSAQEIVGFSEDCAGLTVHTFYVKGSGPMVDLQSLVVSGPTISNIYPAYISENGDIAVLATFASGDTRTVLLQRLDH